MSAASLHTLLVGVRNQAQALPDRLETRGVYVPRAGQREVVRALYVATRCGRWRPAWSLKGWNEGTHSSKIAACDRRQTSPNSSPDQRRHLQWHKSSPSRTRSPPKQKHGFRGCHIPIASSKFCFWVHQVLFGFKPIFEGYAYIFLGTDLMVTNSEYFTWIGGTLMWGLAALIHPVRTDRQAGA